jgi:hypothetical protein
MKNIKTPNWLKNTFAFVVDLPRATYIGAQQFYKKPLEKKRLGLAGASVAAAAVFGLGTGVGVAVTGLALGGMAIQAFSNPIPS